MTPSELRKPIVQALQEVLRPLGYRKKASVFSRETEDVVHLIELQSSRYNTSSSSRFTVNVAVFARAAVYPDIRDTVKPSVGMSQWQQRIGSLSPEQRDLWWEVHGPAGAADAAHEIASRIEQYGLPALEELPNLAALVSLWKRGQSSGTSPILMQQFLSTVERGDGLAARPEISIQRTAPGGR